MWIYDEMGNAEWFDYETGRYVDFECCDYNRPLKPDAYNPYDDEVEYSEEEITELMYQGYLLDLQAEEMYRQHLEERMAEFRMCCSE